MGGGLVGGCEMRFVLGAAILALMTGTASADILTINFTVEPGGWFQVAGTGSPFGLPADPTLSGSFTVDNTLPGNEAIKSLDYTTGTKTWTLSDLQLGSGVEYVPYDPSYVGSFQLIFGLNNDLYPNNTAQLSDGTNDIACNSCVTTDLIIPPSVPEPGVWAMLVLGIGLIGARLRARAYDWDSYRRQIAHLTP